MNTIKTALMIFLIFSVILGIVYPLVMTGVAQLFFPFQANGSLLVRNSKIVGSALIGQDFQTAGYFHGRPSAVDYKADASGASNYGPTEVKFLQQVQRRLAALRSTNRLSPTQPIPPDLVLASASGLDPHISLDAAMLQVPRIVSTRHVEAEKIHALIRQYTLKSWSEMAYVNVLKLNLALDGFNVTP